jgi:hypothetical protein
VACQFLKRVDHAAVGVGELASALGEECGPYVDRVRWPLPGPLRFIAEAVDSAGDGLLRQFVDVIFAEADPLSTDCRVNPNPDQGDS